MKKLDWEKINTAEKTYELKPGGYVCAIVNAIDNPKKEYLTIEYDIAEGQLTDYFTKLERRGGFWHSAARVICSYKGGAQPYFKAFMESVNASNEGYKFQKDFDERTLMGKRIGVVLALEEYVSPKTGEVKEKITPVEFLPAGNIHSGDFTVPEAKRITPSKPQIGGNPYDNPPTPDDAPEISDDDLPF